MSTINARAGLLTLNQSEGPSPTIPTNRERRKGENSWIQKEREQLRQIKKHRPVDPTPSNTGSAISLHRDTERGRKALPSADIDVIPRYRYLMSRYLGSAHRGSRFCAISHSNTTPVENRASLITWSTDYTVCSPTPHSITVLQNRQNKPTKTSHKKQSIGEYSPGPLQVTKFE